MTMSSAKTIDEYIGSFPKDVQATLQKIRQTIQKAAPEANEKMAYGLPTFTFHGNLVHFGAYKTHIGFYPAPSGIAAFQKELAQYQTGKGTLRFSLDEAIPYDLIARVVQYRAEQNESKRRKS